MYEILHKPDLVGYNQNLLTALIKCLMIVLFECIGLLARQGTANDWLGSGTVLLGLVTTLIMALPVYVCMYVCMFC